MSKEIVKQWLSGAANSAGLKDLETRMGIISKRVSLQDVPGFDNIDHDAWYAQCKHEFENDLIESIAYKELKLVAATNAHGMLKTLDTVVGTDDSVNEQGVEMLLEKEEDDVWRRAQERVLPAYEAMSDNLLP